MSNKMARKTDAYLAAINVALREYQSKYPDSIVSAKRQNMASIRIRIIDSRFAKMSVVKRHDTVFKFLSDVLNGDTVQEISMLLLLAPGEEQSLMNLEFEQPSKSGL